jgi:hypothetical protein
MALLTADRRGWKSCGRLMKTTFGKRHGSWSSLVFAAVSVLFELLTEATFRK